MRVFNFKCRFEYGFLPQQMAVFTIITEQKFLLVSGRAEVMKSLSSQIIGEEWPIPGTGLFHTTFVIESHLVGKLVSILVPSPLGPRQFGQFCACVTEMDFTINNVRIKNKYLKLVICLRYWF